MVCLPYPKVWVLVLIIFSGCSSRFVDLVEGYHIMGGYDNLVYGAGLPGTGTNGVVPGDPRLGVKVETDSNMPEAKTP